MNNHAAMEQEHVDSGLRFAGWMNPADAEFVHYPYSESICLVGNLEQDYKGRFYDGQVIRTSSVKEAFYIEDENLTVINTRNSVYFVKDNMFEKLGLKGMVRLSGNTIFELFEAGEIDLNNAAW